MSEIYYRCYYCGDPIYEDDSCYFEDGERVCVKCHDELEQEKEERERIEREYEEEG